MFLQIGKILKKEKGTAALEFSLIVGPLVILLFAIVEFGIIFNNWISLAYAAREAVRLAAVGESKDYIGAEIAEKLPSTNIKRIDITFTDEHLEDRPSNAVGKPVTVIVTGWPVDLNIPFIEINSVVLTSSATLLIEN
jgi:Flp pilus assembly protein TadG